MIITLHITDFNPPDGMKRQHIRAMKKVYERIGLRWASEFLPKHTEPDAESRYGYQPRSAATRAKKQRLAAKGFVPLPIRSLVDRGRLEKYLKRPHLVRGFPTRVNVRVQTPIDRRTKRAYVLIKPRDPNRPNLYKELSIVIASEKKDLEEQGQAEYYTELKKQEKQRGRPRTAKIG